MKLLVLLLVVLAAVWLWKRGRRLSPPAPPPRGERPALTMVRCHQCGMHVPTNEAVTGSQGSYCSAAHRREGEGA